jgi:DNA-directed RNA polymerase subunit RPC12/RpoP
MFTIQCTTCSAKLKVKNEELIGQILACPKCGGMVLIQQPPHNSNLSPDNSSLLPDDFNLPPNTFNLLSDSQPFKKFPDLLTSETKSGIIKPLPEPSASTTTDSPTPPPLPAFTLSTSELQTRKLLLSVLAILFLILMTAIGVLFAVKGNTNRLEKNPVESSEIANDLSPPQIPEPQPIPDSVIPIDHATPPVDHTVTSIDHTATPAENASTSVENAATSVKNVAQHGVPPADNDTDKDENDTGKDDSTRLASLLAQTPEKTQPEIRSTTDLLSEIEKKMPGLVADLPVFSLDIKDRLAIPLTGLKLEKTSLFHVVRLFSDLTEIPMTFDIDEMRPRGIGVDALLPDQQIEAGTSGEILIKVLALLELEPVVEDRQILITVSPERRNTLSERTFDVADLVENTKNSAKPLTPEYLAEILQRLIDPQNNEFIRISGNSLIVQNCFRKLDETLRVLEQLRVIRNLPQQTEVVGEFLVPEAFGWDAVTAPLTLNYYQPVALSDIFSQLESTTKLYILIDHRSLHRALSSFQAMKATVRCNRGTVHEAFEKILTSVDTAPLTYRITNYNSVEITTTDNARQPNKMSVEVHRFTTETDETPEELARTIRSALEPDSWRLPENHETVGQGDIVIDHPSACLLVRQSQPVQQQIRLWIGKKLSQEIKPK